MSEEVTERKGKKAPGVLYINALKSDPTKKKLNIIINLTQEEIAGVLASGSTELKLTGFQNDYKRGPQDPDFNLRLHKNVGGDASATASTPNAFPI